MLSKYLEISASITSVLPFNEMISYLFHRLMSTPLRSESVRVVLKVSFEDIVLSGVAAVCLAKLSRFESELLLELIPPAATYPKLSA